MFVWGRKEFLRQRDALLIRIEHNRAGWPGRRNRVKGESLSPANWLRWGRSGVRIVMLGGAALRGLRAARLILRPRGLLSLVGAGLGLWRMSRVISALATQRGPRLPPEYADPGLSSSTLAPTRDASIQQRQVFST
jgi:hypothetical protein